jgi:hypothetical protein
VSSDRQRENIRLLCGRMLIDLWPAHVQGVANVLANGLSTGLISARSDAWSFNSHIMARWVSLFRRFEVKHFPNPVAAGRRHQRFTQRETPHFRRGKSVGFPPYLSDSSNYSGNFQ